MLVLSRKPGEAILIGNQVKVYVLEISGNQVKLGFEAPKGIGIYRQELYEKVVAENKLASKVNLESVKKIASRLKTGQK